MCYIVFISHSLYWRYIKIALQEYVIIDVIALNETFLSKKHNFKIPGYDTIRNDLSTGQRGGVAFLITKTSLWQPFAAQMEILAFHFSKPLII